MKTNLTFLALALFLTLASFTNGQTFTVPNYKFEKDSDYKKYEEYVLPCIDYLKNTPLEEEPQKRKEATAFLLAWMTGTPTTVIEMGTPLMEGADINKNPEMMIMFMAGWTEYSLKHPERRDNKVALNVAGLETMMAFYEKNEKALKKDKKVKNLMKVAKEDQLGAWVRERLD